jgi:hypothetical protein
MSGVVGGINYGQHGSGGSSKYESYDQKNYGKSSGDRDNQGWSNNNVGHYGDYNYNKSTLDKYKDSTVKTSTSINSNANNNK